MIHNDNLLEGAFIGAVLTNPSFASPYLHTMKPEYFYHTPYQAVMRAIHVLIENNHPITPIDIMVQLRKQKEEHAISLTDLTSLQFQCPSSLNVEQYAKQIQEYAKKRRILSSIESLTIKMSEAKVNEVDAVLAEFYEDLESSQIQSTQDFVANTGITVEERLAYYELLSSGEAPPIEMSTGLSTLDNMLYGLHKQNLLVIAARPGMGKTALALTIARNVAKQKKKVAYVCLEMSHEETIERLLCQEARVDSRKLKAGKCTREELDRMKQAGEIVKKLDFLVWKNTSNGVRTLKSQLRVMKAKQGIDLLIADHIGLFDSESGNNRQLTQEIGEITKQLKLIAVDLDIPVIALSQLSRSVESRPDRIPILSDLRDSGNIEEHANTVLMVMRPSYYADPNEDIDRKLAIIYIRKQRSGITGEIALDYHGEYTLFTDKKIS